MYETWDREKLFVWDSKLSFVSKLSFQLEVFSYEPLDVLGNTFWQFSESIRYTWLSHTQAGKVYDRFAKCTQILNSLVYYVESAYTLSFSTQKKSAE